MPLRMGFILFNTICYSINPWKYSWAIWTKFYIMKLIILYHSSTFIILFMQLIKVRVLKFVSKVLKYDQMTEVLHPLY